MRKAGSTTVFELLEALRRAAVRTAPALGAVPFEFRAMEYESLNSECLREAGLLGLGREAVLVTHLREPLSRINSEFWYVKEAPTTTRTRLLLGAVLLLRPTALLPSCYHHSYCNCCSYSTTTNSLFSPLSGTTAPASTRRTPT